LYFVNSEATDDVSAVARDKVVAERLWEMSEEVCGLATPTAGTDTTTNTVAAPATVRRRKSVSTGASTPVKKATPEKGGLAAVYGAGNGGRKGKSPARRRSGVVSK